MEKTCGTGKFMVRLPKPPQKKKAWHLAYSSAGSIGKLLRSEAAEGLNVALTYDGVERDCSMARRDHSIQMINSEKRQAGGWTGGTGACDLSVGKDGRGAQPKELRKTR